MSSLVLAIDPSLNSTGWAVLNKYTMDVIDCGKITPSKKLIEDDKVYETASTLVNICTLYKINEAIGESQFSGKLNKKVGLQLSRVRGGIMVLLKHFGISLKYYEPSEPRMIVLGNGSLGKEEAAKYLIYVYSDNITVMRVGPYSDKDNKSKTSDIYDAILIGRAYCCEWLYGKAS